MRVLIVSLYYRPEPISKPHELAEGLAALGHEVTVLTAFPHYPGSVVYRGYRQRLRTTERLGGVRVVRVPIFISHDASALRRSLNYLSFLVSGVIVGGPTLPGFDVVYAWGDPPTSGVLGWLLARMRRAHFVYGVHDLWPELAAASGMVRRRLLLRLIGALERLVLHRADAVIVIADAFKRNLTLVKGIDPAKISVIRHWADVDAGETPFPPRPPFTVLYAGNIGRLQGLEALVEAGALLRDDPDTRILLAGDGVEAAALRQLASAQCPDIVKFLGPLPKENMPEVLATAHVLFVSLVPGAIAELSVPTKVVTYLSAGRPILSTVPGETAELLAAGYCGLTVRNIPEDIAAAIRELRAKSDEELAGTGRLARRMYVERFRRSVLLRDHEMILGGRPAIR